MFQSRCRLEKQHNCLSEILGLLSLMGNATIQTRFVEDPLDDFQMLRFENAAPSRGARHNHERNHEFNPRNRKSPAIPLTELGTAGNEER
ncbi:hypothetical protein SAMN04488498_14123 [Mesorhizobium albiziae]|uniref:Uncharacterized protein n=1 Tax=Neomesorhizobium albiziae TaxID=335020 RepID=A0A1I4FEQ1_9HYPH|nr:hypothetical protein GCM10007937_24680 [Mesorhizobium albiziae]SFL15286.1 hypothetical protein SAMN04488498_14123 [Mesorhizobium albiziae]